MNSNSGVVHPLVHSHSISGRKSFYLHTGMTGAIIERVAEASTGRLRAFLARWGLLEAEPRSALSGVRAWNRKEMDDFFQSVTEVLDRPDVSYAHDWKEGDVVVIDNLAVAHKAMPGAHKASSGLRILHRTTCEGLGPLDPAPELGFPISLDTSRPCPWKDSSVVWVQGYVGFRWGDYQNRSVPH